MRAESSRNHLSQRRMRANRPMIAAYALILVGTIGLVYGPGVLWLAALIFLLGLAMREIV